MGFLRLQLAILKFIFKGGMGGLEKHHSIPSCCHVLIFLPGMQVRHSQVASPVGRGSFSFLSSTSLAPFTTFPGVLLN